MRFLVGECLSATYVAELGRCGYPDAVHPMHIGCFGVRDDTILARAIADDRIVITANGRDYRQLVLRVPIHPGIIIIEPRIRTQSWLLIVAALAFIELQPRPEDYMVNRVVEVSAATRVSTNELPPAA